MNHTENQNRFHSALVAAYTDLFANDAEYAYSAAHTTPETLADRMLAACLNGSVNKDGEGIRRACKVCGIPCTLKEILPFVGHVSAVKSQLVPRVSSKVLAIYLPRIDSMMTGVCRILRAHDLVTLEYTDASRESGSIPSDRWEQIKGNVFSIVSAVQAQRSVTPDGLSPNS